MGFSDGILVNTLRQIIMASWEILELDRPLDSLYLVYVSLVK